MPWLPINPINLILLLVSLSLAALYLRRYYLRKSSSKQEEKYLEEAREKAYDLLNKSYQKSQNVIGVAELEGIKMAAESRLSTNKLEEELLTQLKATINQSQQSIQEVTDRVQSSILASEQQFRDHLTELQIKGEQVEAANLQVIQEQTNKLFEGFETKLSDFLIQTEQKTTQTIELELRSTRELIETYKEQQLSLIDENIIAVMERTLSIVLGKKLSLKEHVELVYEALEKAKAEKFIA